MIAYPKYRVNCWFNEVDDSVKYGVDIKTDKQSAWRHIASNGSPLFFEHEVEAKRWIKDKRASLNKGKSA